MQLRVLLWMYSQARPTVGDVEVFAQMANISMGVLFVGSLGGPHMKVIVSEHVRWIITAVS